MKKILGMLVVLGLATNCMAWYGGPVDADTLDGNDSTYFLSGSSATATYLGQTDKAADSDLLDNIDSTAFWQTEGFESYFTYDGTNYEVDVSTALNLAGPLQGGIVYIGDSATVNYADGDGDLYVKDELEVDGKIYAQDLQVNSGTTSFTGDVLINSRIYAIDAASFGFGSNPDMELGWDNTDEVTRMVFGTDHTANATGVMEWNAQSAVIKSSTTAGLQKTTPLAIGEVYWNTDTNELWVSTGTAINQFIAK